jgi:hypothetical protein
MKRRGDERANAGIEQDSGGAWMRRAGKVIDRVFRRSRVSSGVEAQDLEDARASILVRILERLRDRELAPIDSFDDFVARAAFHALDDLLRARYPGRARLKNRIRYALLHDARFSVNADGHTVVCALVQWPAGGTPRTSLSRDTATTVMLDAAHPADALHAMLAALRRAVALDELVDVAAELWQVPRVGVSISDAAVLADTRPLANAALETRQTLAMLWASIQLLPPRQRAALLLHVRDGDGVSAIPLLVLSGTADLAAIAETLGSTETELEALWSELPLDDNRIATILGSTRQQVINLRKAARERLARDRSKNGF